MQRAGIHQCLGLILCATEQAKRRAEQVQRDKAVDLVQGDLSPEVGELVRTRCRAQVGGDPGAIDGPHAGPADDPRQRKPDISLAGDTLDWQPSIALETGLQRTIDYFSRVIFTRDTSPANV